MKNDLGTVTLTSDPVPNALADESFVDREIEVAFNNLGKVKQEMHKFYDRTRVQARLVRSRLSILSWQI